MINQECKKEEFLKIGLTILLSLVIFLGIGEIVFRAFYPDYKDFIFSKEYTYGKQKYEQEIFGGKTRMRTKGSLLEMNPEDHVVLVFGDSVTFGYGLAYEDIYWSYWQRMLDLVGSKIKIIAIAQYGNNYASNFEAIRETVTQNRDKFHIDGIIYQYNFNDLLPYSPDDLKGMKHLSTRSVWISKVVQKLAYIRLRYLNHSVMLRVLSNKFARLMYRNSNVGCRDLGLDGLESYTYSFVGENSEETSLRLWDDFKKDLLKTRLEAKEIPFVLLVSPIAQMIEPEMKNHVLSRPKRFDCAKAKPAELLADISREVNIHFVDPTMYMKEKFDNYVNGGNPERFFHLNDDNHPNALGSKYFSEYSYVKIFGGKIVPLYYE
ncbi:MAG: hypothetical protein JW847_09925 [Candidatus Omnitrophica bacterium]|nr:hypothetical protein [Candidatus Omnitrophota bacterium]